ncbi:TolC family protein, partial [Acinetobacter baumannii]
QAQGQGYKVANEVRIHYYEVLAAIEKLRLENELLKSMKDHWLTVHEMLNVGQATGADRTLANATIEEQHLKVMESENRLQLAWENLTSS